MRKPPTLTIVANSTVAESAHSTFTMDEVTAWEQPIRVEGIGDGLGEVVGAAAVFRITSYATATTFDPYAGFDAGWGYSFSTTSLDVSAAAAFEPGQGGPAFEGTVVSQFQAGPIGVMVAGVGSTLNYLSQQSGPVPITRLRDGHVEGGFLIDVEAQSLATPYVDGVPNVTGVFGSLLSDAVVYYDVAPKTYGNGRDTVKGTAAADAVALGGGNDVFRGGGGNDAAVGERGADVLRGQGGRDGLGGGGGNDRLFGNAGGDLLDGGGGRDRLVGGGGDDALRGGAGHDLLVGGGGGDTLEGGRGRDLLVAGAGDDTLTGGAGADRFDFRRPQGSDVVTDFDPRVDVVILTRSDWRDIRGGRDFVAEGDLRLFDDEAGYEIVFTDINRMVDLLDSVVVG